MLINTLFREITKTHIKSQTSHKFNYFQHFSYVQIFFPPKHFTIHCLPNKK